MPALRSGYGGLKIFCGQPTLPTHSACIAELVVLIDVTNIARIVVKIFLNYFSFKTRLWFRISYSVMSHVTQCVRVG